MDQEVAIGAAAALHDPIRRRLLQLVSASIHPVTRDAAGASLGVSRSTVAFHLDRLVDAGLLTVGYQQVNGRVGPGSGRPAKTYVRTPGELSVSLPERHYDLMGDLLATAIETAPNASSPLTALRTAAATAGREAGHTAGTLARLLAEAGYEPVQGAHGISLANCPFHRLARRHTEVVCAANHSFLCAAAEATGNDPDRVLLEPSAAGCCVWIES
ncbi:helix-turn-helix domain-containing protein [Cryobacterium sp. PH29-G1]|uniref:helix-turn-helix transcriptional regulator n=1 Tax=Cryobacterium sp. PH29-G1 TaxID=3046211 RepID=UPI0024BA06F3|nr:helix-turn-helix domain-containing protein [Cryobacterium sp. PH29-G1]MDJ0349268.1 helix-turn-helix domain-containing protein [Cryobacterium sp. PH29-G1]